MKIKGLSKICINLLTAVVIFIVLYCINFGLSWINNLSYCDMLLVTLPFLALGICTLAVFGYAAEYAEEKRQQEIRRKKRNFVLKKAYRNRNNIVFVRSIAKYELFN